MTINNLSSILLAALFIISTVSTSVSFSQEEVVMDSIITGSKYRITMYNDKEIIGRVAKQDSVYVYMVTDEGTVRIRFEDIFSVSKSTIPRLISAMFTLGGGVLLQGVTMTAATVTHIRPVIQCSLQVYIPSAKIRL